MTVQISQNHSISQLNPEKIDLLKRTICKGSTNEELELFLHACNRTELDPFMRQIYFVKMGGTMTVQTGIDGYRLIAERSKKYMPGKESTFIYDKAGKLFSATSYVKKLGPDNQWHEISATAIFSEYKGRGPLWDSKPHIMLSKCSEALALRKAFPADLSGLYTKEEMEHGEIIDGEPNSRDIRESQISIEIISEEEAEEIEHLLSEEDPIYRDDLLKYFTNAGKMPSPMVSFKSLPKRFLKGCRKSIMKRREERLKRSDAIVEKVDQNLQEVEF